MLPGALLSNAMALPSGDQLDAISQDSVVPNCCRPDPSAAMMATSNSQPWEPHVNAMTPAVR